MPEKDKTPVQWTFAVNGLLPHQVKLKRKLWLKKDEILLEMHKGELFAHVLGTGFSDHDSSQLNRYMWITSLLTNNAIHVSGRGGVGLSSAEEFGKKRTNTTFGKISISSVMPDEAVPEIEKNAPKLLRFIGKLHDKYIDVIEENEFIALALEYFHEAERKFVYNDEGFISAMISLEALFSEGGSDIKYKLSHRAAFILGLSGMDSIESFEKLKVFYNNRSKLVHGGGTLPYDSERHMVARYTRRSIIIFLILLKSESRKSVKKRERKQSILKEIDYAMLDNKSRELLRKEIINGMKVFKFPVPRIYEGKAKQGNYRIIPW